MQYQGEGVVFFVGNIPGFYHSSDLRTFFSNFVEKRAFLCFHFKHRPELERPGEGDGLQGTKSSTAPETVKEFYGACEAGEKMCKDISNAQGGNNTESVKKGREKGGTLCCVGMVKNQYKDELVSEYNGKKWVNTEGELLPQKAKVLLLTHVSDRHEGSSSSSSHEGGSALNPDDLATLQELNPPSSVMPQGNVGTPLSVFMELIRTCRLPCHVIRKLRLNFSIGKKRKRYSAVPMDYSVKDGISFSEMSKKHRVESLQLNQKLNQKKSKNVDNIEQVYENDSDDDAEEWERYEALHEDVDKQGRTSERLFENELEVVWEKGGSGLVFYTDSSYWDGQEGDFEEKCSKEDDWDVDMSLYYGCRSADKPAQDMKEMAEEKLLREGNDISSLSNKPLWKGKESFGEKLLKKKGWMEGSGLGLNGKGIAEPIQPDGQFPACKTGLGYYGEKLNISKVQKKSRANNSKDILISTIYDDPDKEKDLLTIAPSTTLKYRQNYLDSHKSF